MRPEVVCSDGGGGCPVPCANGTVTRAPEGSCEGISSGFGRASPSDAIRVCKLRSQPDHRLWSIMRNIRMAVLALPQIPLENFEVPARTLEVVGKVSRIKGSRLREAEACSLRANDVCPTNAELEVLESAFVDIDGDDAPGKGPSVSRYVCQPVVKVA